MPNILSILEEDFHKTGLQPGKADTQKFINGFAPQHWHFGYNICLATVSILKNSQIIEKRPFGVIGGELVKFQLKKKMRPLQTQRPKTLLLPHTFISVSLLLEGLKIVSTVLDYSRTSSVSAFGKDNACSKRKKTDLCGLREKSDYRMILAYRGKVPVTVAVLWTQKSQ